MGTPILFKYYLQSAVGDYYTLDATGAVITTAVKTALPESPKTWANTEISFSRDESLFGVFRKFSVPMDFAETGAVILRHIFHTYWYDAYCKFVIEKREDLNWTFATYYEGEIDFSKFIGERDNTQINIMEAGLPALFKAKQNTPVEIPVDDPDAIIVNHDGIKLNNRTLWIIAGATEPADNTNAVHVPTLAIVNTETVTNPDAQSQTYETFTNNLSDVFNNEKWIFKATTTDQITINYDFSVDFTTVSGLPYLGFTAGIVQFMQRDISSVNTPHNLINESDFNTFFNTVYTLQGTLTITPAIGDEIYLLTRINPNGSSTIFLTEYNTAPGVVGTISISYTSRFPATNIPAFRYIDFAKKLVKKSLGNAYSVISDFLSDDALPYADNYDNRPYDTVVTSGAAIRQLPDATIKTSLAEMRQDIWKWGLGIGFEGAALRIEPLNYFLDKNTLIATVPAVTKVRETPAIEFAGNTLKAGYPKQTYDTLNGLDETNGASVYSLPVLRVVKEIDWSSNYNGSIYAIEFARAILFGSSTDSQYDNAVYLMEIEPTPTSGRYNLLRLAGAITGVLNSDTGFNWGLSPARTPRRLAGYLKSFLHPVTQANITFETADKNKNLVTDLTAGQIVENGDINVPGLPGSALFLPSIIECEGSLPENLILQMLLNPYGRIDLIDENGNTFGIYPMDVSVTDATNNVHTIRGLSTPDNDLTLINA